MAVKNKNVALPYFQLIYDKGKMEYKAGEEATGLTSRHRM